VTRCKIPIRPSAPPARLEARELSLDVGPTVVDVIKDQNPVGRQQVARDIGLLAEISDVVIADNRADMELNGRLTH
jgi:hypothetical protein